MSAIITASRLIQRRREGRVVAILAAVLLAIVVLSLAVGAYSLSIPDLVRTLLGGGAGNENFIVLKLRLPRVSLAVLAGVAFAVSGALFQTVLRNPLASPDIIGVTGGASAAAVFSMLILGLGGVATSVSAFLGALIVAAAIYVLAWRGGVAGYRFVLIGVGIAFMVQGFVSYLLSRADLRNAQEALVWLVGSVSGARWQDITVVAVFLAVLLPAVAVLSGRMRGLQMGDDAASALGIRVERARLALLVLAVALAAVATAAVGPLAFIAFVSAPIARRVVGTGGLALLPAALVGAIITTGADFVAQHLLPGDLQLPAGIVTGAIGAPYLLWLLATANRNGKGA
ncbi:iron complex transport system permease protein [Glaciihabitans tibetensis]|uniref:Iron complex transport system permease protein n=1 Tax=Glaciihabitans tibetensis TaxID=1266600 RepID=A0A2T0VFM5_9MICO|nr:iron chelate uptake ABC transporter family permease subunit [Glaciihabitans tibetensis]PRY69009.1 iron complex transport system permease protein [Glaciihabitans tibetensis]